MEAEAKGEPVPNKKDYSYEGPLPRRKEAVIVEIADICEAASRAELQKWDHIEYVKVRDFVDKLIMNKMKNRQFDDAELTIGELTIVCDVIASSICRLYHGRPQYAKPKEDDDDQKPQESVTTANGPLSTIDLAKDLPSDQPEPAKEQKPKQEPAQEQKSEPPKEQKTQQASGTPAPPETQSPKPPSADEH